MFRVGTITPGTVQKEGTLFIYGDNRESPIEYTGEFNVKSIVSIVLKSTDDFLKQRSQIAKALKDQQ